MKGGRGQALAGNEVGIDGRSKKVEGGRGEGGNYEK